MDRKALDYEAELLNVDGAAPSWFRGTTNFRLRIDGGGVIRGGTQNVGEVLGCDLTALLGRNLITLVHPDDLPTARDAWIRVTTTAEETPPIRTRLALATGAWRWFEVTSWNVLDVPRHAVVIGEFRDVQAEVDAEAEQASTARAHQRLMKIFDEVEDVVMVGRLDHGLIYLNHAAQLVVGDKNTDPKLVSQLSSELRAFSLRVIEPTIRRLERWTGDLDVHVGGRPRIMATTVTPVAEGGPDDIYYGVIMHDVTADRTHTRAMAKQARRDPLTGLPNRLALMEHLDGCRTSGSPTAPVSVCFIDLDNLKIVNDGLGHSAGDRLLRAVGAQLLAQTGTLVARFGGDEFVVVHEGLTPAESTAAAEHLLIAIRRVQVLGIANHVSASIGVAGYRRDELDPERVIRDADAAMYVAKRGGRDRVAVFDRGMREVVSRRFFLESALRDGLAEDALAIHLQPIIALNEGDALSGFEALARWPVASPSEFIPIAEDSGLIVPLGRWAVDQALGALAQMTAISPEMADLRMGVNVSAHQLLERGFADMILGALDRHGVYAKNLVLELTESVLIDPRDDVDLVLLGLANAGVSLALDDFGSGYSSLGYLRRYPIDVLKLDTTYTQALLHDQGTRIIAEGIVTMANRLGLRVVAEGVETPEELEVVRELGIDWAQGFLLGRPAPVAEIVAGLAVDVCLAD